MDINYLLFKNKMTKYQLVKLSGVPHSTIFDICSYKTLLRNCSAITVAKIAKVFNMTVDELLFIETSTVLDDDYEAFKSTLCHNLKAIKDKCLINKIEEEQLIEKLYDNNHPLEALYTLALHDYLCRINNIENNKKYDFYRMHKMDKLIYPRDVILTDKLMENDNCKKESLRKSIPEFLIYNIVEVNVTDVF